MKRTNITLLIMGAAALSACGSDGDEPTFKPGGGTSGEATAVFTTEAEALEITRSTLAAADQAAFAANDVAAEVLSVNLNANPSCASGNYRLLAPASNSRTAIEFDRCDLFNDGINSVDGVLNGSVDIQTPAASDSTTIDFRRFSFLNRAFFSNGADRTREFEGDIAYGSALDVSGDTTDFVISSTLLYRISENSDTGSNLELNDLDQETLTETLSSLVQLDAIGLVNGIDFDGLIDFETEVPVVDTGEIVQGTIVLIGADDSFIRIVDSADTNKADVEIDFDGDGEIDTDPDLQWDWFGPNGILGLR